MKFILIVLTLLLVGCDNPFEPEITFLNIHLDSEKDSNGYYHFPYNPTGISESDYGTVYYMTTDPVTRVGWYSPDGFYVEFMGQMFWEPVINYSTYSGDDGEGQQLFYVNETLIGDTLDIYGYYYYYPEIIDSVKVIIGN